MGSALDGSSFYLGQLSHGKGPELSVAAGIGLIDIAVCKFGVRRTLFIAHHLNLLTALIVGPKSYMFRTADIRAFNWGPVELVSKICPGD